MSDELVALLGGVLVGRVRHRRGRSVFIYDDAWRDAPDAYPLSLAMPMAAKEHGTAAVEAFLWGLLPDDAFILQRWAQRFQVSARNAFALLSHVGMDCAGAVQLVASDRLDDVHSGSEDQIDWLDERDVADRLRTLREDHAAWRLPRDAGQFTLAGGEPKTALLFDDGRTGVPAGRIATTHIFKPATGRLDGHVENEHVCLALARALGLPVASSRVRRFEGEVALVLERYDRQRVGNEILRVHQEDACQALGVMPAIKYQKQGGPGVADVFELVNTQSSRREEDTMTFLRAVGFNWLIGGTDAHARNHSLLIARGPRVRLAPLYDLASILPYDEFDPHAARLAMQIGGEYELSRIGSSQWRKLARALRLDADAVIGALRGMAAALPDAVSAVVARARQDGLDHAILDRLSAQLVERVRA